MPTSGGGTVGSLHRLAKAHWGADLDMMIHTHTHTHTHTRNNKSKCKNIEDDLQIGSYLYFAAALSHSVFVSFPAGYIVVFGIFKEIRR